MDILWVLIVWTTFKLRIYIRSEYPKFAYIWLFVILRLICQRLSHYNDYCIYIIIMCFRWGGGAENFSRFVRENPRTLLLFFRESQIGLEWNLLKNIIHKPRCYRVQGGLTKGRLPEREYKLAMARWNDIGYTVTEAMLGLADSLWIYWIRLFVCSSPLLTPSLPLCLQSKKKVKTSTSTIFTLTGYIKKHKSTMYISKNTKSTIFISSLYLHLK